MDPKDLPMMGDISSPRPHRSDPEVAATGGMAHRTTQQTSPMRGVRPIRGNTNDQR